jgi:hypothetical protein
MYLWAGGEVGVSAASLPTVSRVRELRRARRRFLRDSARRERVRASVRGGLRASHASAHPRPGSGAKFNEFGNPVTPE